MRQAPNRLPRPLPDPTPGDILRQERRAKAYAVLRDSPEGRALLWEICDQGGAFTPNLSADAVMCGRQSLALEILNEAMDGYPTLLSAMCVEKQNHDRRCRDAD